MTELSTREACGLTLVKLGEKEKNIVVLDADLSASTQTRKFAEKFPNRFFDMGCAEQNMIGTAAGLALSGKVAFASTFASFMTRGWEQIRNTVAHDNINVKLIASHSGFTDAADGATHQCFEDIAIMRCLPNMCVFSPVDVIETEQIIENEIHRKGCSYIRLNRIGMPKVNDDNYKFEIGKPVKLTEGNDVTIFATGTMVSEALKSREILQKENISVLIINVPSIKPLDKNKIVKYAKDTGLVVTVEEHNIYGGLGSTIAEILIENYPVKMKIMGVKDRFGESGEYKHLQQKFGLNYEEIVKNTKDLIRSGKTHE